jgi:hypothetical protein
MIITLKIILVIITLSCLFFGRLLFREYKLFNKNIETKSTSLAERVLVNGLILIVAIFLIFLILFNSLIVSSSVQIETWI